MSTGCGNGWKMLLTCGPHINEKYARRWRGKKRKHGASELEYHLIT